MTHSAAAEQFNLDEPRVNWHDEALWFIREKRDKAVKQIPEWELLRGVASDIKDNVLENLDVYLTEFEANATKNGITVHWAADAAEHNQIVLDIIRKQGVQKMVKSKSMLTEELHLNPFLEKNGIEVIDTY